MVIFRGSALESPLESANSNAESVLESADSYAASVLESADLQLICTDLVV